ncbi:MAG: hypothetical protein E7L17_07380 [Clostridium sp.]|uniref:hypothetical protein n=1 Tax=Clostridium sp. TaxID=1506 RepID=UPI00290D09DA|nr:hypothetical protein [Clostridium sp.]MDU7337918.1 hypothetical protein [Clostridium sp.]
MIEKRELERKKLKYFFVCPETPEYADAMQKVLAGIYVDHLIEKLKSSPEYT